MHKIFVNIDTNGASIDSKENYIDMVFSLENCRVLIEFSTSKLSTSKVLHRCEVYIVLARILLGYLFKDLKRLSHFAGTVRISVK